MHTRINTYTTYIRMHTRINTYTRQRFSPVAAARARERERERESARARARERERLTGEDAAYPSPQKHASDRPGGARGPGGEAYALWSGGPSMSGPFESRELCKRTLNLEKQCRPATVPPLACMQAASLLARMQAASLHACIRLVRVAVVQVSSRHSSVVVWWLGGCSLCGG